MRTQTSHRYLVALLALLSLVIGSLAPTRATAAPPASPAPRASAWPTAHADSRDLKTWGHDHAVETTGPVADSQVRSSPFYAAAVATTREPGTVYDSFVYLSSPRGGQGKTGYTEEDGAEFAANAGLTMSWTSFEYSRDVYVDVRLRTGQSITSADQVTIRPTDLGLESHLLDPQTVRVKVPYSKDGYRFSVEFEPQLITAYNDLSGTTGTLTTQATGNRAIHTEPQNSMLVFANPAPQPAEAKRTVPTEASGTIYRPEPGLVTNLDHITEEIVYFGPGVYSMGATYHARLPESVKWIYLAPGAYVKGAFKFEHDNQPSYKVTGLGVLSGENYVYEADTSNGYQHNVNDNCHESCVKMLQFTSSDAAQTLDLQGITINQPPYHSFVVYDHRGATEEVADFVMTVDNYKQVGGWYWQTDGIELYPGGRMQNTFFHANDDVLKLYHSDVEIKNTVIWKNENGPVVQWGWTPRSIDGVSVRNTDIIHNRMYWKDVKLNTCVFNSSTHWEDMGATDRADISTTIQNLTFTDTRVEGMVNCGVRIFALSNTRNVVIDGFSVDAWNGLDPASQVSLLKPYQDATGATVTLGDQTSRRAGLLLHNYTVSGVSVLKAGDNWAAYELGRLGFAQDVWAAWDATADRQPRGKAPALTVEGLPADGLATSRALTLSGTTTARTVTVSVNGETTGAEVAGGRYSVPLTLTDLTHRIVVTATSKQGVMTVQRFTVTALGTLVGSVADPAGDDHGPGTYTYPTDSAFTPGSLDLTGLGVYRDGDLVRFAVTTAGPITNPWGGNGMSTQRVNVYLSDGASDAATPLLPGTNASAAGGWQRVVVADGRNDSSPLGSGVYAADLARVASVTLDVDPAGRIVASVPASALAGLDLRTARYQVSMLSSAEDGEGEGNVRPVYSTACAQGVGCPDFVGPYRLAGGAGEWTDAVPSRDTDTSDPNLMDIISGDVPQAEALEWSRGPVVVPYVGLAS